MGRPGLGDLEEPLSVGNTLNEKGSGHIYVGLHLIWKEKVAGNFLDLDDGQPLHFI